MKIFPSSLFRYAATVLLVVIVNELTRWGGVLGCAISLIGIYRSRTIVFLFLSFINFSLSLAFDNFIRVDPTFYFYDGRGASVAYLCVLSTSIYLFVGWQDSIRPMNTHDGKRRLIDFKFVDVSPRLFWLLATAVFGAAVFVLLKGELVLSATYDAYELQKYPFLEYVGLLIAFLIQSSKKLPSSRKYTAIGIAFFYSLICFATSYRMVGIISMLAAVMIYFNGRLLRKDFLVVGWLLSYVGLTYISYWRIGHFDVTVSNIFGYERGRMDNTFTGVIETALIYTSIGGVQKLSQNLLFFVGALLPYPNSLIPDSMIYVTDALNRYYLPGGGAFAGFVIYFNYLYLIPFVWYVVYAFRRSNKSSLAAGMYLILFITVTRWWLYGPYVLFKFLGVFIVLLSLNWAAKFLFRTKRILIPRSVVPHSDNSYVVK